MAQTSLPVYGTGKIKNSKGMEYRPEAAWLPARAGRSMAQPAYGLTFTDNPCFNRFFKKYAGRTPDEFRKNFTS